MKVKRFLTPRALNRFKIMTGSFGVIMAISLLTTAVAGYIRRMEDEGPFTWESAEYTMKEIRETHTGYIEEYTNNDQFC